MARIGINGVFLEPARTGGAESYTRGLIHALTQIESPHTFVLFLPRGHDLHINHPAWESVVCDIDARHRYRRLLWEQYRLPGRLARQGVDLAHFPYGTLPLGYRGPSVVTLHDTLRYQLPRQRGWIDRTYRRMIDRDIARFHRHVILPSSTDGEIFAARVDGARVHAVPHGIDARFTPRGDSAGGPCVLWVGRPYGYKNLDTLRRAHALAQSRSVDVPPLRLVGADDPPIAHDALPACYRAATLLCHPSLCESFALPVLEAMACGTPVVGHDLPVFRELYGQAMLRCDAGDVSQLARAIEQVCADASLRDRLIEAGLKCAAGYSWHRCAAATLSVYDQALDQGAA